MLTMRPRLQDLLLTFLLCLGVSTAFGRTSFDEASPPRKAKPSDSTAVDSKSSLTMSRAVICRSIDGFEQYEPLGNAEQTSNEKLLVYYRPDGYQVAQRGEERFVHFSQDGIIRRRGQRTPVRRKLKLLNIKSEGRNPPEQIFLRNTVSLKGLPPGDYEYDIVLRDENAPGESATQTVPFRIIESSAVPADDPGHAEEKGSTEQNAGHPRN